MEQKEPPWFKNAIIYQLHIKGFHDARGDGIGDFAGLTKKLDYLESLGVTAIWVLPFYPSPLKDDGYDIANYNAINTDYGTLSDFKNFLHQAHSRSLKVITELVINHTSDQHPWFQLSRRAPENSIWRNFYIWSDDPHRYKDARIIFKDFETSNWTWDPIAKAYYFHRFYSHQPDLNFESTHVQKEVFKIMNFWLKMGVDGLRLDAIPYLYKKEKTNCENLQETHAFIKKLRKHVDTNFSDRALIAEANQWPEDAAAYFGNADECHMAFHFPVMPRLFMAIHMEDRFPIIDILEQTPVLPPTCQWIMFLRNHDELTLEMVSDEERDYMYRIYAKDPKARLNLGIRRRLAPLLNNDRNKIELMNILLFSLPGTPVLYYGDEIGMGDNYYLGDRNGVRTPMQWNADRNAGFSKANPQKLYLPLVIDPHYHYELVNVENQEQNPSSLLWWIRHALAVRKNHNAFGSGSLEFIAVDNPKILAFVRSYEDEIILVVVNLSRFSQAGELNLAQFSGYTATELFHQTTFPTIKETPYIITLSPHGYFWIALQPSKATSDSQINCHPPKLPATKKFDFLFKGKNKELLEKEVLPKFLVKARWYERKTLTIQRAKITSALLIAKTMLCTVEVHFQESDEPDVYLLPISFAAVDEQELTDKIASVSINKNEGFLYDAIHDEAFRKAILELVIKGKKTKSDSYEIISYIRTSEKSDALSCLNHSKVFSVEQSNSSFLYGKAFFFKLFRRLEEGMNPDIEISRFLTEKAHFANIPAFSGLIGYKKLHGPLITFGFLERFIPNEATAWNFTLDSLSRFYEQALAAKETDISSSKSLLEELIGGRYLDAAKMLGEKTAQLHIALSTPTDDPEFAPEAYSTLYQRSLYQDMRNSVKSACQLIRKELHHLDSTSKEIAKEILNRQEEMLTFFKKILEKPIDAMKIRIHGDYHLGQLLYTGKDFYIIDFEGEPLHTLTTRRRKRSPLRDVAGMIRSFHYAVQSALQSQSTITREKNELLETWANLWYHHISELFVQTYLDTIKKSCSWLLPKEACDIRFLLDALTLEKALYETAYELNVRPTWAHISLKGLLLTIKQSMENSKL